MKRVTFIAKPPIATPLDSDSWVQNREIEAKEPSKRFTFDVPLSLHKRIKTECARRDVIMADAIREILERTFPITTIDANSGAGGNP